MTPYTRPVSLLERYALGLEAASSYQVVAVIEGAGDIAAGALREAVAEAAAVNPGMRVRLDTTAAPWRWVGDGPPPGVREVNGSLWDGRSERHTEFLDRRLDPSSGPVAGMVLVRGRDGLTRVVVRGLHAAFDGRGLLHWSRDVFRALRHEPLQGSTTAVTDDDVRRLHRDRIHPRAPGADEIACIPILGHNRAVVGDTSAAYVWRRIDAASRGSNSLGKTAVFLAQWARKREAGEVGFTVPVDYRHLRTESNGIGNLTGYLRLPVAPADTPGLVLRRLLTAIRDYADCREIPLRRIARQSVPEIAASIRRRRTAALFTVNSATPSGGLVSMGFESLAAGSCPGFRALSYFCIPPFAGKLNVVIAEQDARLVAVFAAPAPYNHRGQLDELTRAYQEFLSAPLPPRDEA